MKKFKYLLALLLAVPIFLLIARGISEVDSSGFAMKSNKTSPSGEYTVYQIESVSEEGNAPYGQHLVLTDKKFVMRPEDGKVIFAGYCKTPLVYEWKSDQQISIQCTPDKAEGSHTKVKEDTAFGIKIDVQYVQ